MELHTPDYVKILHDGLDQALKGPLEHTSWVFDNFRERVLKNVRPGLFLYRNDSRPYTKHLLEINMAELSAFDKELVANFPEWFPNSMFGPKVDEQARSQHVTLDFDYDHSQVSLTAQPAIVPDEGGWPFPLPKVEGQLITQPPRLVWKLIPTPPPPYVVFGFQWHYDDVQKWQWEYVDAYETWYRSVYPRELLYRAEAQIGGWADFRQDADYDEYIAQANTDHGDHGAVYLSYSDGDFYGHEQMC
jgi:hypothetical protein